MSNSKIRTNKCKLITKEMTWQEILAEYRKLNDNNDDIMTLSNKGRMSVTFALFAEHRHNIIQSLPKNLSEREFKRQLYFKTYGENLPENFFKSGESKKK